MTALIAAIARDLDVTPRDLLVATLQAIVAAPFLLAGLWAGLVLLAVAAIP